MYSYKTPGCVPPQAMRTQERTQAFPQISSQNKTKQNKMEESRAENHASNSLRRNAWFDGFDQFLTGEGRNRRRGKGWRPWSSRILLKKKKTRNDAQQKSRKRKTQRKLTEHPLLNSTPTYVGQRKLGGDRNQHERRGRRGEDKKARVEGGREGRKRAYAHTQKKRGGERTEISGIHATAF